jgi:hypothetical protein
MPTTIGRKATPVANGDRAQVLLEEEGEEEEDGEDADVGQREGHQGTTAGTVGQDAQGQQRMVDPALEQDEGAEQQDSYCDQAQGGRTGPAVRLGASEAVDQRQQTGGGGDCAG